MARKITAIFMWSIFIVLITVGVGMVGAAQTPEPTTGCEDVPAYFEEVRELVPEELIDYYNELNENWPMIPYTEKELHELVPLLTTLIDDLEVMEADSVPSVAVSRHEARIHWFISLKRFTAAMADGGGFYDLLWFTERAEVIAENREGAIEHGRDICGDLWPADSDEEDAATPSP